MSKVKLSVLAEIDLDEIYSYIAEDNRVAAVKVVKELHEQFRLIANHPAIGRRRNDLEINLRGLPHGKYLILYMASENDIEIYRVLHMSRDIDSLFH